MNILLVSQCSGRALPESRRILDQFAERRGERTWQTPITMQGLDTLRKLLRKSARRNTAVACHWIRGRNHSELVWIVGNAQRFNSEGAVPTNTTSRDVLRITDENDWHTANIIQLLACLAGLFHDLGKAWTRFQQKLTDKDHQKNSKEKRHKKDLLRHEWVSLRLFLAFVGGDDDEGWLNRLVNLKAEKVPAWLAEMQSDGSKAFASSAPLKNLPALAQTVAWLLVSHHFLPQCPRDDASRFLQPEALEKILRHISPTWNRAKAEFDRDKERDLLTKPREFSKGTPFASTHWCRRVSAVADEMLGSFPTLKEEHWLDNPYVIHLSRLCLMLSDHYYSSLKKFGATSADPDFALWANTRDKELNQRLDDHLLGVGKGARRIARSLPELARQLPRIAGHRGFSKRTKDPRFRWQDKAYDLAASVRQAAADNGFFGVNMASTGCGKTLANARIMYGLANPQTGARFSVALGLRVLTLQTGEAYRQRLGLGSDALAVRVGGAGVKDLFEYAKVASNDADTEDRGENLAIGGSESAEELFDDTTYIHYEGSLTEGYLLGWLQNNPALHKLVSAPVLVTTIDHLIPATEGTSGGRQLAPLLRLLSSDLILDEPDDFDMADLPALSRLVNWVGMLGGKILLSSATLAPAIVEGLFEAYLCGRRNYLANRGRPGQPLSVVCAWFDEFNASAETHDTTAGFAQHHCGFVQKRVKKLQNEPNRRQVTIDEPGSAEAWSANLVKTATRLHQHNHETDPATGRKISIGLIRMANVDPLIDTAVQMFGHSGLADTRIHLCCYHAKHPLLIRSAIEQRLDRILNRTGEDYPQRFFADPDIRQLLDSSTETHHILIVLATAVAEVGRDHDYDWAVVEPSSMRSIIQLAGRVRRHRGGDWEQENVVLLASNWRNVRGDRGAVFLRPGFENNQHRLDHHALTEILEPTQYQPLNAIPRILERESLQPKKNLADLEHHRLRLLMGNSEPQDGQFPLHYWWNTRAHLSDLLQKNQRFRAQRPQAVFIFEPDDDGAIVFRRVERRAEPVDWSVYLEWQRDAVLFGSSSIQPWPRIDLVAGLEELADAFSLDLKTAARRFTQIELDDGDEKWKYHPDLGFRRNSFRG